MCDLDQRRLLGDFMPTLGDGLSRDSSDFAEAWRAQTVTEREGGVRAFAHSRDGPLRFALHAFHLSERPDYKLVMLTPA